MSAGVATAVPRWCRQPVPGAGEREVAVPAAVARAVHALAERLELPLGSLLLAAHAAVLAAVSGEHEVVTGYVAEAGAVPLPCRLAVAVGSWRSLLRDTDRRASALLAHRDLDLDTLRPEPGPTEPPYESVVEVGTGEPGTGGALAAGTVVRLRWCTTPHGLVLRVRYRRDALDEDSAARLAGYHLRALELMAEDPEGAVCQSLLSAEELDLQLRGLSGPARERPDKRFFELFEQQAHLRPDDVAAVRGDDQLTYRELNTRANQVARALRARGLRSEGVVAVVTERTLDWLVAVIAVLKAGGVYLPVEPHFPAERIATTLRRAGCRMVLTEPGCAGQLDVALVSVPDVDRLTVVEALVEGHEDGDLFVRVGADQLAYVYFTSGSTGEPKGAMCEHAGFLNHLLAKVEDLGINEGTVVAQTAPQCFDISLWQLVAGLLVGGRTLIVEQEAITDVERFVDTVAAGRVGVLQLVPSYLEVVLTYLEHHPRPLPDLRVVSATGEALKKELTERFFATLPGLLLVNAYGLTETSDDTNHEVMDRVPVGARVPLGPPIANVRVYVVDEELSPVPLGAPGLIAFSGVCVGRGYVNDPERTREAYRSDPHVPGSRLYLGGDYGRWLPEGSLEFLGRRDSQVKIAGFRIEIGEIENTLLRVPGVRDAAVVVAQADGRAGDGRRLVAFYAAERPLPGGELRDRLAASLPGYLVPPVFCWQERLPLTANSKIDRAALTALAAGLDAVVEEDRQPPRTATERRLAAAWAQVLGVAEDRVGRSDSFFDLGGTSLSAVKLAIALDRAVSLKDVVRHPVLADLAEILAGPDRDPVPSP